MTDVSVRAVVRQGQGQGTLVLEWTGGPLPAPCVVRDQEGREHAVSEVAFAHCPDGGTWFGVVRLAGGKEPT